MSSRAGRFVERTLPVASGPLRPLNEMAPFLMKVPDSIDLREALLQAGADADFVIRNALPAVKRASANGVLKKLNLTEQEALVIAAYTVEGTEKSVSMYDALNQILRGEHSEANLIRVRQLLVLFLRTLRLLPVVKKDKVFRGIDVNLGRKLKTGDEETWWAFTSVTWNADTTNTFVGRTGGSLFIIEGQCQGYDLSCLSVFPDEAELLLEPEMHIKAKAVIQLGPNASSVFCEIVPSDPVLPQARASVGEAFKALYMFNGEQPGDLTFKKGDIVYVTKKDGAWWEGTCNGRTGPFPSNFVVKAEKTDSSWTPPPPPPFHSSHAPVPHPAQPVKCDGEAFKALYAFNGEQPGDLTFKKGDIIFVTKKDGAWWEGTCNGQRGPFPSNYVDKA